MEPKTTVIADDREAGADVVAHLRARPDCEVIIRRLRLGDYHIAGRLLVERKCWPDLVASIVDGRLFRQACRLAASPLHTVVLLEGSEDIAESAMAREAIQGALISDRQRRWIDVIRIHRRIEDARPTVPPAGRLCPRGASSMAAHNVALAVGARPNGLRVIGV